MSTAHAPTHGPSRRSHQYPTVLQYMTASPITIARNRSLAVARQTMIDHRIRHLPVLEGGRAVGLLSERDLFLVESLPGVNPTAVLVEEAMVGTPYQVPGNTPLAEVVETMVARKIGSAVVTEGERVVGVLTAVDALRALSDLLAR